MSSKRDDRGQWEKEDLIDRMELLGARLVTLEKRVAEWEGRASAATPAKTPENASMPSSQGWTAKRVKKAPAKRGPKVGHMGNSRALSGPDEVRECRVAGCQGCGHEQSGVEQHPVGRRQGLAIAPMRRPVGEARCYAETSPRGGHHQVAGG